MSIGGPHEVLPPHAPCEQRGTGTRRWRWRAGSGAWLRAAPPLGADAGRRDYAASQGFSQGGAVVTRRASLR